MYNFPDERLGQFSDPVFYLMINGDLKSDNIDALFTGGVRLDQSFIPLFITTSSLVLISREIKLELVPRRGISLPIIS